MWAGALLLAAVHGYQFTIGYRLSADDILCHHMILESISKAVAYVSNVTTTEGRIGGYAYLSLNVIGAYLVDFFAFRVLTVALFYSVFLLISIYVSQLLRANIALLLFVVAICLNPLDLFHFPPNAYPLETSIPFLLILGVATSQLEYQGRWNRADFCTHRRNRVGGALLPRVAVQ